MPIQLNRFSGWDFSTSQEGDTEVCACNDKVYCKTYGQNDTIYLQLAPGSNTGDYLDGCPELSDPCYTGFTISDGGVFDADFNKICWGPPQVASGPISFLEKDFAFVSGTSYVIKVTISNFTSGGWFAFVNDLTNDSATFTEGGTFYIKLTANATGTLPWGIGVPGAGDDFFCIEGLELYEYCDLTGDLLNSDGDSIATLNFVEFSTGAVDLSFLPSETTMQGGQCYQLKIIGCGETYYSNCIKYTPEPLACSLYLKWRNNRGNAYGFDYSDTSDYNTLRVEGKLKHPLWPNEQKNSLSSTGVVTKTFSRMQQTQTLALNDLPEYLLRAVAAGLLHDTFLIDGVQYVLDEGAEIAPAWRNSSPMAPLEVTVLVHDYDAQMNNCG